MSISLSKGQRISLEKSNGDKLSNICMGVNWGVIQKKGLFGTKKIAVDLDASCFSFDADKQLTNVVYFGELRSVGIQHSGDDRTGDVDGDDGLDNEVISVNLSQLPATTEQIVFVLNSYEGQDFKTIPFASIRIYEGTPDMVKEEFATYDIANSPEFAGAVSMVLGKLYKSDGEWKFTAIGEITRDRTLQEVLITVQESYT